MVTILAAILVFSAIVLFHEFGHFLMAKLNGIGVLEFSLGFGPRIVSFVKGGTRYSLKCLPLGGSCMMGEDMDEVPEYMIPRGFHGKWFGEASAPARFMVIFGGPLFNFIMALVCAAVMIGMSGYDKPVIASVMEGYPAGEAGLMAGDTVTGINGHHVYIYRDITAYTMTHAGADLVITYTRNGEKGKAEITPQYAEEEGRYLVGIRGGSYTRPESIGKVLRYSVYELRYWVYITYESLFMLVRRQISPDNLSGPVRIVSAIGTTVQESAPYGAAAVIVNLLNMVVLLSVNLGIMNLLPLPALDGGRLLFILVEMIRHKRVDPELEAKVHIAGFALLMALMVFVFYNDIRMLLK